MCTCLYSYCFYAPQALTTLVGTLFFSRTVTKLRLRRCRKTRRTKSRTGLCRCRNNLRLTSLVNEIYYSGLVEPLHTSLREWVRFQVGDCIGLRSGICSLLVSVKPPNQSTVTPSRHASMRSARSLAMLKKWAVEHADEIAAGGAKSS